MERYETRRRLEGYVWLRVCVLMRVDHRAAEQHVIRLSVLLSFAKKNTLQTVCRERFSLTPPSHFVSLRRLSNQRAPGGTGEDGKGREGAGRGRAGTGKDGAYHRLPRLY